MPPKKRKPIPEVFVVASDSRQRNETLFMVDRRLQRASFWSDRLSDVMKFPTKEAAQAIASRLCFNNPRPMPLHEAMVVAQSQSDDRELTACMDDAEVGWDAHKDYV